VAKDWYDSLVLEGGGTPEVNLSKVSHPGRPCETAARVSVDDREACAVDDDDDRG
jgi:hypothetical protein